MPDALNILYELSIDDGDIIFRHRRSSGCRCGTCWETAILISHGTHIGGDRRWDVREIEIASADTLEEITTLICAKTAEEWRTIIITKHEQIVAQETDT